MGGGGVVLDWPTKMRSDGLQSWKKKSFWKWSNNFNKSGLHVAVSHNLVFRIQIIVHDCDPSVVPLLLLIIGVDQEFNKISIFWLPGNPPPPQRPRCLSGLTLPCITSLWHCVYIVLEWAFLGIARPLILCNTIIVTTIIGFIVNSLLQSQI